MHFCVFLFESINGLLQMVTALVSITINQQWIRLSLKAIKMLAQSTIWKRLSLAINQVLQIATANVRSDFFSGNFCSAINENFSSNQSTISMTSLYQYSILHSFPNQPTTNRKVLNQGLAISAKGKSRSTSFCGNFFSAINNNIF